MTKKTLCQYQSRRNCAYRLETDIGTCVCKRYQQESACRRELLVYEKLRNSDLPHARVLLSEDLTIWLTHLPGKTLLEVLENQESSGRVEKMVWQKLAVWLVEFFHLTGFVMQDVNLRNFLYDEQTQTLYGLDFEECGEGDLRTTAARLAAYIRTYYPENTPLKQEISDCILQEVSHQLQIPFRTLIQETEKQEALLKLRRMGRT